MESNKMNCIELGAEGVKGGSEWSELSDYNLHAGGFNLALTVRS
jgi:hypothetical protein